MKLIAFVRDIANRQWLGRTLNDAGFFTEISGVPRSASIKFVTSSEQAERVCAAFGDGDTNQCVVIAWSAELDAVEKLRLLQLAGRIVLVDHSTTASSLVKFLESRARTEAN